MGIVCWLIIISYFLVCIFIGYWASKKESTQDFLIGSHKVGFFQTTSSIFAVAGGEILIAGAALGFEYGFNALWLWVGTSIGLIGLAFAAKHIRSVAGKNNFMIITDYLFEKYDYKCTVLAAIILFIGFFALLSAQFIAGASLFAPIINVNYSLLVIIIGFGTLIYVFMGGYNAVVETDVLQAIIMFVIIMIIAFVDFTAPISNASPIIFENIDIVTIIIFVLMGIFSMFSCADIWQRVISAKDNKTARNSVITASVLFFLFGIAITIIGIVAKTSSPELQSTVALSYGLFQILPSSIAVLAVLMILAAIMSTIDTELFMLSTSIAKDFIGRKKGISDEKIKSIIKYSLIGLTLFSVLFAIFFTNIITIVFGLVSVSLIVTPIIIGSIFWKLKNNAVFTSLLLGLISLITLFVLGFFAQDTAILPLPVSIITLVIGQFAFKK